MRRRSSPSVAKTRSSSRAALGLLVVRVVCAALGVLVVTTVCATLGVLIGPAMLGAAPPAASDPVTVQILAVNDLHGALEPRELRGRPVGGAAVLTAYLDQWTRQAHARGVDTITVGAGDLIGGSPPISALLRDEPTIAAVNLMDLRLSAVGNHEFDRGLAELLRLQDGGCHPDTGCFAGARFRYLAANVVDAATGELLFPAYRVERLGGVPVGFIGAVLKETPTIVSAQAMVGIRVLDEIAAINDAVAELRAQGVRAIVVLIHQGGRGNVTGGPITGEIVPIVAALDDEVDVVVSGHTHQGYQGYIAGKLVTQAFANGTAFAAIDLVLDRETGDVQDKRAEIVNVFGDVPPGDQPDPAVAAIVAEAAERVAPLVDRVVGVAATQVTDTHSAAGESALGNLIADAQRWSMEGQIGFMNPGGVRADLHPGPVRWGDLFTVQPFGNQLVGITLTGAQIERLLEQQWEDQSFPRILHVSGLSYTWDRGAPTGERVALADIRVGDQPIDPAMPYRVVVNDFLADGANNFSVFLEATDRLVGPTDLEALVDYVAQLPQPFTATVEGRIQVR
jgi:5'-nucleotidase